MPPDSLPAGLSPKRPSPVPRSKSPMRLARSCRPEAEQAAEKIHIFVHRKGRVEVLTQPLRHVGDPRAGCPPVPGVPHVAVEHFDRSDLDVARAGDQVEEAWTCRRRPVR